MWAGSRRSHGSLRCSQGSVAFRAKNQLRRGEEYIPAIRPSTRPASKSDSGGRRDRLNGPPPRRRRGVVSRLRRRTWRHVHGLSAVVRLHIDGTATVYAGSVELGQGRGRYLLRSPRKRWRCRSSVCACTSRTPTTRVRPGDEREPVYDMTGSAVPRPPVMCAVTDYHARKRFEARTTSSPSAAASCAPDRNRCRTPICSPSTLAPGRGVYRQGDVATRADDVSPSARRRSGNVRRRRRGRGRRRDR